MSGNSGHERSNGGTNVVIGRAVAAGIDSFFFAAPLFGDKCAPSFIFRDNHDSDCSRVSRPFD